MSTPVQKLLGFLHLKRALKLLHKEKYLHLLDFRNLNSIQLDCKVKRKMKIPQYTLMNSNLTLLRNSNKAFLKEKWNGNMCPFKSNLVENFENILEWQQTNNPVQKWIFKWDDKMKSFDLIWGDILRRRTTFCWCFQLWHFTSVVFQTSQYYPFLPPSLLTQENIFISASSYFGFGQIWIELPLLLEALELMTPQMPSTPTSGILDS